MPLSSGSSPKTISTNVAEMRRAGHPEKQAVAASLSNARRTKRGGGGNMARHSKKGGRKHGRK